MRRIAATLFALSLCAAQAPGPAAGNRTPKLLLLGIAVLLISPLEYKPIGVVEVVLRRRQAQIAADEFLHDFVGAGPDLRHTGVPPCPRDTVFVHVPVPTVDLNTRVEDLGLGLRTPPLGLRAR